MSDSFLGRSKVDSVSLVGDINELTPIIDALNFFKVPFEVNPDHSGSHILTISYGGCASVLNHTSEPTLCLSSDSSEFQRFLASIKVEVKSVKRHLKLNIRLRGLTNMQFNVSKIYSFRGPLEDIVSVRGIPLIVRVKGTCIYLLSVNIADEIKRLLNYRLDLKPSLRFRIYSQLPINSLVPKGIGNRLLGLIAHVNFSADTCLRHLNLLDGLRYLLLGAIAISSERTVSTLWFWPKGVKYVVIITHDADTEYGVQEGVDLLRKVERKYGVKTAWNIPAKHYRIEVKAIKALASEDCEIGLHGYRHDGRLIFASKNGIVKKLLESKERLTEVSGSQVKGFRAPLLQHSKKILRATAEAGFIYDSSIPAWEAYCRTNGKPHGVGTIYPFIVSDCLVELPVTLPQDHQLMYLGGLSLREILELWRTLREHIKFLGGLCNVIIHPDKDLFGHKNLINYYEVFIGEMASDPDCWLTVPSKVVEWWILRDRVKLTSEEKCVPVSDEGTRDDSNLEKTLELVDYRPYDFAFE